MDRVDFIEWRDLLPFQERLCFGPSPFGCDAATYQARAAQFRARIVGQVCLQAWDIWSSVLESTSEVPRRHGDFRHAITLAPIARWIQLVEHEPGSLRLRYRYMGQGIVERYGRDLTGLDITAFNGVTPEENWTRWRPTIEEGRPGFAEFHYGLIDRRHVTVKALNLPVMDESGTRVRFVAAAVHYPSGGIGE